MKNVYDLEGNYYEWTAEASYANGRVDRGGGYGDVSYSNFGPGSYRDYDLPTRAHSYCSARAGLYVNL